MDPGPKIKIHPSPADKLLDLTGWIILGFLWIFTLYAYFVLPGNIPTHFNAAGQPDGYGNKITLIILPVIGTIIFVALTVLMKYPHLYHYNNFRHTDPATQYLYGVRMIRSLKTAIILLFALINVFTYLTATQKITGPGVWFLPFTILIVLLPQVYYIITLMRIGKKTSA